MNKITWIFIFAITALSVYSQKNNCEFGIKAQKHIENGRKLMELSYLNVKIYI